MTSFLEDMTKFIHELKARPVQLVDEGIAVNPQAAVRPSEPPTGGQRPVKLPAAPPIAARQEAAKPPVPGRPSSQIISYFIDYFVVFVTVAGVYFGYRMVSHTTDMPPEHLTRYGVIFLVCLSVLFLVYKTLHRALAVPTLGQLWRSRYDAQRVHEGAGDTSARWHRS